MFAGQGRPLVDQSRTERVGTLIPNSVGKRNWTRASESDKTVRLSGRLRPAQGTPGRRSEHLTEPQDEQRLLPG